MLTALLALAAFVAGLTGSWSPCGFSMVSTLGEHARGRAATLAACAAFVPGAVVGGVVTFGALGAVGALLGSGDAALVAAAIVAGAAALAEAAGIRIAPQIRRQVPEHWRRVLPLPVAAAGYGVLLGLGFTTFVLTFAVWALAGVALAVGSVTTGAAIGVAFAVGRALPVVVLAPQAERPLGLRATELMADRPAILRGFRAADALALAAVAVALGAETANAATRAFVDRASDPSASGADLAFHAPDGAGVLRAQGVDAPAGRLAAIGGRHLVTLERDVPGADPALVVTDRLTGAEVRRLDVDPRRATGLAVSDTHVAYGNGAQLVAGPLDGGRLRTVARSARDGLGRPALDGAQLVWHDQRRTLSRIALLDLGADAADPRVVREATRSVVTNPSVLGGRVLYVETTQYEQRLVLGALDRRSAPRELLAIGPAIRADKGFSTSHGPHRPGIPRPRRLRPEGPPGTTTTLWTTALAPGAAYVTRLRQRGGEVRPALLRVAL